MKFKFVKSQLNEFDDLVGDKPVSDIEDQWDIVGTIKHLTGRDPQVEQQILRSGNPGWANLYAFYIIKGRWPEAEPLIMKDPGWAYGYARYVIRGRWPEAESAIMKDPKWAYFYAKYIINGRWPEAEPVIMKDPESARRYTNNIIQDCS